jgi:signal transduction histidine kinase
MMFEPPQNAIQLFTLITACACFAVGLRVIWLNPRRFQNQAFLVSSGITIAMLFCIYGAMQAGRSIEEGRSGNLSLWIRMASAINALLPCNLWLIATCESQSPKRIRKDLIWLSLAIAVSFYLSTLNSFVGSGPKVTDYAKGPSYYWATAIAFAIYAFAATKIFVEMKLQRGIKRVELQFLYLTSIIMLIGVNALNVAGNFFGLRALNRASIISILATQIIIAWALTNHKIFNAKQVLLSLAQRASMLLCLGCLLYFLAQGLDAFLPVTLGLPLSAAVAGSVVFKLDRVTRAVLDLDGAKALSSIRETIIDVSRTEHHPERLKEEFEETLRSEFGVNEVSILVDREGQFTSRLLNISSAELARAQWPENGWVIPEMTSRRPSPLALLQLNTTLIKHNIQMLISVPRESFNPSLLIAIGNKRDAWPFTYPEIIRLLNAAELIDNILAHSNIVSQASLRLRIESVSILSRGLAHDLKNLITPIASFLVHVEKTRMLSAVENEVHQAAKRAARMMTDYVRESQSFNEKLAPVFGEVDLGLLYESIEEAMQPKATRTNVRLDFGQRPSRVLIADSVLLQRMIINILDNAIDASVEGSIVTLETNYPSASMIAIAITDEGCGIPEQNFNRVFEPYFTTKQFGDTVRGFGLGLAIAQKIATLHKGTLSIRSTKGVGTTVIITLPIIKAASKAPELEASTLQH